MYKDLYSCKNKNAVVFGGLGLIGTEITKALAEFGAVVHCVDIKEPHEKIDRVIYYSTDIRDEAAIKDTLKNIIAHAGQIHILVNCAYPRTSDWGTKFEDIPYTSWNKNFEYQMGTCFVACQIVAEHMKQHRNGSIVNIGSTYGVVGPDFAIYEGTKMTMPAAYAAIKGGIINFTKYLATYYARDNIRVNCLSPGGIFDHQAEAFVKKYEAKTPLGRMGTPQEMAAAVVFLASDAASYVTGHNLMVDGGWTIW
ncbi:MAG: SDR family oxidoreductase [Deltaproteobacteria bacterium]|nr:SDR family oxidoreductase [Deltaproteobacteria bacterium]